MKNTGHVRVKGGTGMPENRDCGRKNLFQMSTEELEQILRQDAEAPADQEADTDFLMIATIQALNHPNKILPCSFIKRKACPSALLIVKSLRFSLLPYFSPYL